MEKLKNLLLMAIALFCSACTASAKSDKDAAPVPTAERTEVNATASGEVVVLTKADFLSKVYNYEKNPSEWVYEGDKPAIIDFYADWCGPCKRVAPILDELAGTYKGKLVVYKINVDNEKELAAAFGIQSIPSLLFIPMKGVPRMSQGALSREQFVEQIDGFLLK